MENKKYIKISLSTLLLIIAIFIIVILSIIICILLNENKLMKEKNETLSNSNNINSIQESKNNFDLNNKNVEENNNMVNTEKIDEEGITLPQLEGTFYSIESITKESREIENVKNYKDFEFDLDNDGEIDKVTLRHIINEDEELNFFDRDYYVLEYNGELIYKRWYGIGIVGIVDLDNTDSLLEIWVYDEGQSDDPCYCFF